MRINSISTKKAPRNSQLGCFGELFLIDSYLFDLQICVTSCRRCTPGGPGGEASPSSFLPNTCSYSRLPAGVAARPPSAVSFNAVGIASPTRFIARIASSAGIGLRMPASASCAATRAPATPAALRWMREFPQDRPQGHTQGPIHCPERWTPRHPAYPACRRTIPQEPPQPWLRHCRTRPDSRPARPAMHALFAITIPTADAVNSDITQARSGSLRSACNVSTAAGRIPQEPAVGAATIRPHCPRSIR